MKISNVTANPRTQTISQIKRDQIFIEDFIKYYGIIKHRAKFVDSINDIPILCQDIFEENTRPFYEKWKHHQFIDWNPGYAQDFHSFVLRCGGTKILIPHRLLSYEIINPENRVIEQLKLVETILEFEKNITRILWHLNLPLCKNDIKLIEMFIHPLIKQKIQSIPTNRQLAQLTELSENTISRRLNYLYQKTIVSHLYRVDMAKLGYETVAVIYQEKNNKIDSEIDYYCLLSIPIDWGEYFGKIKVFQIPYHQRMIWQKIKKQYEPHHIITLTKSYIGYDLTGLHPKPNTRWKILPPILDQHQWHDVCIAEGAGIEMNLFNDMSCCKLSPNEISMLNLIQNGTLSNTHLSTTLNVTPKYIKQFFRHFFKNKLITRFTTLTHLGLDLKVGIYLLGKEKTSNHSLISKIINHLKFFPFCFLIYTENNVDQTKKMFITGLIRMPSQWIADFAKQWLDLTKEAFIPKLVIEQGMYNWGIDLSKTYFPR
ncbi:hypothetical protein [Candidatus Hodarchaeum mangrovi]